MNLSGYVFLRLKRKYIFLMRNPSIFKAKIKAW
jgi:hypothetical protein